MNTETYMNMDMLRFITAGSVDDGKSTLIGRLLFDSKQIFDDQMDAIEKSSERRGDGYTNLALLTDGLKAEREQGITIDIAYKYFATPKRKFIIADAPGHIQYTRNMVTGASTANLAIILIDARKGVIEQTYRHTFLVALLDIPYITVCINKLDLVDYSEEVFEKIKADYLKFAKPLVEKMGIKEINFVPISALNGDNVVDLSTNMPWYKGQSLIQYLENVDIDKSHNYDLPRFPVQLVIRPIANEYHDYRAYAGMVNAGVFRKGDTVTALPSGIKSKIKAIDTLEGEVLEAFPPMSVAIRLEDEVDVSRGDMLVKEKFPVEAQEFEAYVCWMDSKKLQSGGKYLLRHTTNSVKCIIKEIKYKINISTLERIENQDSLELNDIAKIVIKTAKPIFYDEYATNRGTGACIIIDEGTNQTSGACMIIDGDLV
jgi:sulfate adenylyltransferase subunit 1